MADDGTGVFAVVCNLSPGYHQFKFIVDGEWRHDEAQAFMPDPLGNVNNWLFVKAPDNSGEEMVMEEGGMEWSEHRPGPGDASAGLSAAVAGSGSPTVSAAGMPGSGLNQAEASRARILDFLQRHTAYELIPESSKVVVLDTKLPVRQAFHALYEQGIMAAPLWDEAAQAFVGMMAAGDFIHILRRFSSAASLPISEAELDKHTIAVWREEAVQNGGSPRPLVSVGPEDSLHTVAQTLMQTGCAMVPLLVFGASPVGGDGRDPESGIASREAAATSADVPQLLHLATLSGVLACIARHFRGVPAALPLLSQPIGSLPIGTWTSLHGGHRGERGAVLAETRGGVMTGAGAAGARGVGGIPEGAGMMAADLSPICSTRMEAPLASALADMLAVGVSALPVVDANGALMDVWARSDITALAHDSAYSRVLLDDLTVAQALALAHESANTRAASGAVTGEVRRRLHTCNRSDTLRTALETFSLPGVRRLICVDEGTQRVEGVISLTDVGLFLIS